MTYGVVAYTDFMVVGIDHGVSCCEACGALVPFDRRSRHDEFHIGLRTSAEDTGER